MENAMAPMPNPAHSIPAVPRCSGIVSTLLAAAMLIAAPTLPRSALAGEIPTFAVDAAWPKPLPNNWIIGEVGGITADSKGHIWVFHRPRSLTDNEKGASLT